MIAGDQLGFGFGQVKRKPIGFGKSGHQKDDKGERLAEYKPRLIRLVGDDFAQIQIPNQKKHGNDGHAHGDFVGNHLGAGANAA